MLRALEVEYAAAQKAGQPVEAKRIKTQIYNKLDVLACGVLAKMMGSKSREFSSHLIIDLIALEEHYNGAANMGEGRQGEAWKDLAKFCVRRRRSIDARKREYEALDALEAA